MSGGEANDDGIDITFHETTRLTGIFYTSAIDEYKKYMSKKKNAKVESSTNNNLTMLSED